MKALALKELREVAGIAAIALALYLALVAKMMGSKLFDFVPTMPDAGDIVPFMVGGFTGFFMEVSALFALALGFRQSAWESSRGTYLFLLHRPLSRNAIFLTKLATGAGVYLLVASVPIVLYGGWAAIPGHHPGPFEWAWTAPAWWLAFLMLPLYLAAFLSGLRPARWLGTRLLPLIATITVLTFPAGLSGRWMVAFTLTMLLGAVLLSNICYVARTRDYA